MKKYNVQYPIEGCSYGEPLKDYYILSEHCFLLTALWTAYKLLSRQSKIKVVKINKYEYYVCGKQTSKNLFKLEKL